jgi:hypothetical protein
MRFQRATRRTAVAIDKILVITFFFMRDLAITTEIDALAHIGTTIVRRRRRLPIITFLAILSVYLIDNTVTAIMRPPTVHATIFARARYRISYIICSIVTLLTRILYTVATRLFCTQLTRNRAFVPRFQATIRRTAVTIRIVPIIASFLLTKLAITTTRQTLTHIPRTWTRKA